MKTSLIITWFSVLITCVGCGASVPKITCAGKATINEESEDLVAELRLSLDSNSCSYEFTYTDEKYRAAIMLPNQDSKNDSKYSYPSLPAVNMVPEIDRFVFLGKFIKTDPSYDSRMDLGMQDGYLKIGPAKCSLSPKDGVSAYELKQEIFDESFTTIFINPVEKYEIECTSKEPFFLSSAPWIWAKKNGMTLLIK